MTLMTLQEGNYILKQNATLFELILVTVCFYQVFRRTSSVDHS